jgi:hypothetical protein
MAYTITDLQIIGQTYTVDLADLIEIEFCEGTERWSAIATENVTIVSIVGSIVTYIPTASGDFSFNGYYSCDEIPSSIEILGEAVPFQATVSSPSGIYNFNPCCNDCFNPIIVTDLYEGDTYIPFSLDMEDGVVVSTLSGEEGKVLDGVGVIELSNPLVAGESIQLKVNSDTCKAVSSVEIVKSVSDDCDSCANPNRCHIRLLSVAVKHDGVNLVSLSSLSVEAFGELRYRLDNGLWFSDWASIGSFNSLVNHTLGIKLVNNPSCRIEYPFLAISYT